MTEHYFSAKPKSKLRIYEIEDVLRGIPLKFFTASGVFSPRGIDYGTKLLIEKAVIKRNAKVLDLGCGYGVIGITVAKVCPSCRVYMSDINERAVMLAHRNAKLNEVNVTIRRGNLFEPWKNMRFDIILCNPPLHAGLEVCYRIIEESYHHLNEGGMLEIVAKHRKGGKRLSEKMREVFGNVETVARSGGYRVYLSVKG